jgi:hypothetical protein
LEIELPDDAEIKKAIIKIRKNKGFIIIFQIH